MKRRVNNVPSSRKVKKIVRLILPVGATVLLFGLGSRVFTARQIECYSQFGTCPVEIVQSVGWLNQRSLVSPLPLSKVRSQLQSFPEVYSVSLHRRLPSTVVVSVALRRPLGAVGTSVLGAQATADEEGYVFKSSSNASLPLLITENEPATNQKLAERQISALKVLNEISPLASDRIVGTLSGTTLTIQFSPDTQVLVDINRPQSQWYSSLQLILNRSRIMAKMPRKIDLRFNNSVIVY